MAFFEKKKKKKIGWIWRFSALVTDRHRLFTKKIYFSNNMKKYETSQHQDYVKL